MTTLITGNTYPVRAELRALGGIWNKAARGWEVPADKVEQARALVITAKNAVRRTSRHAGYTRFSTGAEVYRNLRGRCEDAPCCGCCS
ncbi:MAG: hypothetical protein QOF48_3974 [Verrucomicrobiota bacterium]|jgi:hypothetical protein